MTSPDDRTAQVRWSFDEGPCREAALVLRALGIGQRMEFEDDGWALYVHEDDLVRALDELREYDRERAAEEPQESISTPPTAGSASVGALGYAATIIVVFGLQTMEAFSRDWVRAGANDVTRVRAGEWWRTLTALTLHVDPPHLVGNLAIGGIFVALYARVVGTGVAWSMLVLSGGLGNALAVALKPGGRVSVGASTAVFGALGALAAWQWTRGRSSALEGARKYGPIVMGFVLLSYLGTGGERTDVLAHVTGCLAGAVVGYLHGRLVPSGRPGAVGQRWLAAAAVGVLVLAWARAFGAF